MLCVCRRLLKGTSLTRVCPYNSHHPGCSHLTTIPDVYYLNFHDTDRKLLKWLGIADLEILTHDLRLTLHYKRTDRSYLTWSRRV